jgi:hypothetical protein
MLYFSVSFGKRKAQENRQIFTRSAYANQLYGKRSAYKKQADGLNA